MLPILKRADQSCFFSYLLSLNPTIIACIGLPRIVCQINHISPGLLPFPEQGVFTHIFPSEGSRLQQIDRIATARFVFRLAEHSARSASHYASPGDELDGIKLAVGAVMRLHSRRHCQRERQQS